MKYTYAYKTSDGQRHEATIEAASREAAFAELRTQGIKPIKVVAADGTKANGEVVVRGVRRRVVTSIAVLVALIVGAVAFGLGRGRSPSAPRGGESGGLIEAAPLTTPRHQIYGDPVIMGEIEHGKTEAWLPQRSDRILAWFAQPGKLACPRETDLHRAVFEFEQSVGRGRAQTPAAPDSQSNGRARSPSAPDSPSGGRARSPSAPRVGESGPPGGRPLPTDESGGLTEAALPISADDAREVRELKQIVNGLKEEMTAYLANGNGTVCSYWRRLMARTREEMQIYERTRRELERETDPKVWNEKNESLRILGLRTIPNPKEME